MKRIRICAAAIGLAASSYAWAQPAEDLLGQSMPQVAAGAARPAPKGVSAPGSIGAGAAKRLNQVQGDSPNVTRGAAETRVYQQASPAVVMILTEDGGLGSGALISTDGQIITNAHVVGDDDMVFVVFKPKAEGGEIDKADMVSAKVLKRDEVADLALIKVNVLPPGITPLKLGSLAALQVGADVNAIGHPTGQSWTYTRGIVSQIRRDHVWTSNQTKVEHRASVIQTQTPINPGNSGGPLLDDAMQIVGLNSFTAEGEGLNFAISADEIRTFLARPGDRLATATAASAEKAACEVSEVGSSPAKDGKGTYYDIDGDCDGKADFAMFVPKSKKEATAFLFDEDDDGKIETVIYDTNHDGDFDYALYDTDSDGKPDVRGEFRKGEDEPYRMEKLD